MANLNIEAKEPQPTQYTAKNFTLDSELVKNETSDGSNDYFQINLRVKDVQLPDFSISNVDVDSVNDKLIANAGNGSFSSVRVGDTVTDSAGSLPANTTVSSINGDYSEITLDSVPTSDQSNVSVTVTPQKLDATLSQLRINLSNVDNTDLNIKSVLYGHTGNLNKDKRNSSGTDDVSIEDSNNQSQAINTLNIFDFINNVKN